MAYSDLNGMTEGDLMYTDQLCLIKEEIIISSDDESINLDGFHSDSIVLGDIDDDDDDDDIQIISCKIETKQNNTSNNNIQIIEVLDYADDDGIKILSCKYDTKQKDASRDDSIVLDNTNDDGINVTSKIDTNQNYTSIVGAEVIESSIVTDNAGVDEIEIISGNVKSMRNIIDNDGIQIIQSNSTISCTPWTYEAKNTLLSSLQNQSEEKSHCDDGSVGLKNVKQINEKLLPKGIKKRFDSRNFIDLYCCKCNKVKTRLNYRRSKIAKCQSCKTVFKYQCTQCNNLYKTFQRAFLHVKFQCHLAKNYNASFHCSVCYYYTRSQKNLDSHILNHHSCVKCVDCNEECENSQMTKHQLFQCKFAVTDTTKTKTLTITSSDNTQKRRGRKPKYTAVSTFLCKYCKTCDESKGKTAGDCSMCKECNNVLLHQCITCCKRFQNLLTAKMHVRSCNYPPLFQCSHCDYHTAFKANFIVHYDRKHEQKECEVCLTICDNYKSLKKHEKYDCKFHPRFQGPQVSKKLRRTKKSNFLHVLKLYCCLCKEVFERTSSMLFNCIKCNSRVQLQCNKCLVLFNNYGAAYRHIQRGCRIEPRYKCCKCDYKVSCKRSLLKHMRIEHADPQKSKIAREKKYTYKKCPECHKNNLEPESFNAHVELCKTLPSFKCSSCSFSTKKRKNLSEHFKNIHKYAHKYFPCPICKKQLKFSSLRKHQKMCQTTDYANIDKTSKNV